MIKETTQQAATSQEMPTASPSENQSFLSRNWQKLFAVVIWVALVGGFFAYIQVNNLSLAEALLNIVRLMQTPYGPLIYLLIYAVRPLAFFSATVLTLAAGSIFGPILGVLYTIVASNTSATVAYFLGQFLGQGVLSSDKSDSSGLIQRYADRMRNNSFETILIMRFIFLPYDLVNYLAGFLRINYKSFILATILGSIPGTFTFVLAGASVPIDDIVMGGFQPQLDIWFLVASGGLFLASLGLSRYFKQREAKRQSAQAN